MGWNNSKGKSRQSWWSTWEGAYRQHAKDREKPKGKGTGSDKKKDQKGNKEKGNKGKEQEKAFHFFGLSLVVVSEATVGGRGTQRGDQVPEGKWCRAKRNPFRIAQNKTRTFEQSQGGTKILEPRKKFLVKIEKIKRKMKQKKDAWEILENAMKERISRQTTKHQEDMALLEKELSETGEELKKA